MQKREVGLAFECGYRKDMHVLLLLLRVCTVGKLTATTTTKAGKYFFCFGFLLENEKRKCRLFRKCQFLIYDIVFVAFVVTQITLSKSISLSAIKIRQNDLTQCGLVVAFVVIVISIIIIISVVAVILISNIIIFYCYCCCNYICSLLLL